MLHALLTYIIAATPSGTITEATGVSLGLILAALGTFGGGAWWIVSKINKLTNAVNQLRNSTVTEAEAAEHALRLAMLNPGMRVPDPRDPTQILGAERARRSEGDDE